MGVDIGTYITYQGTDYKVFLLLYFMYSRRMYSLAGWGWGAKSVFYMRLFRRGKVEDAGEG